MINESPVDYHSGLESAAANLSSLSIQLGAAHDRFNTAEDAWLREYDAIAVELKDQMMEAGRKSDPSEHAIVSATRRRFPDLHRELRESKRALDRLEKQSSNQRSTVTAYQSLIKSEHTIGGADPGPQPQWSGRAA